MFAFIWTGYVNLIAVIYFTFCVCAVYSEHETWIMWHDSRVSVYQSDSDTISVPYKLSKIAFYRVLTVMMYKELEQKRDGNLPKCKWKMIITITCN